jgi:MYXO-CTERM domain-containing protein
MSALSPARFGALSVFFAAACGIAGCAEDVAPQPVLQTTNWHIRAGEVNQNDPNVLVLFHEAGNGTSICSSSLIAPNLLLTARHCVSPTPEQVDCGAAKFGTPYAATSFFASTEYIAPQNPSKYIRGSAVYVPEESASVCGFDMAMVILSKNVDPAVAKPLIPRVHEDVVPGESYRAVGYGATDAAGNGAGTRRQRTGLAVNCVGSDCPIYSQVNIREWEGDTGICQGDSGGPALDTQNRVIGVVSRGPVNGPVQCDSPTYGSVYKWEDWIVEIAKIAAEKGNYPVPEWAGGPPAVVDPNEPPVVDPGTTPGTPPGEGGEVSYGVACSAENPTCASGTCIEDRGFFYCSHACDDTVGCPATYTCTKGAVASFCTSDAVTPPKSSSGSCSVGAPAPSRDPMKPVPWIVSAGALAGLVLARRRARSTRSR